MGGSRPRFSLPCRAQTNAYLGEGLCDCEESASAPLLALGTRKDWNALPSTNKEARNRHVLKQPVIKAQKGEHRSEDGW
ncbi:hypothetical protein NDU88_005841 [Pleurodeles waltl]|uniref:Uncharacterized protein n=1 Tax=Pleurodeles waltl TaxID=8319 RepID=A0AAV7VK68_PLEWA|nr:hypothetical protein NDU88_005841 [Pleurodeles waltl]